MHSVTARMAPQPTQRGAGINIVTRYTSAMAASWLTAADYRALADFRYPLRRFLNFSEQAARAAGLEPQQHQLLLGVKGVADGQRTTIGALAERLQLRHHSVVELVDRTEARGLVQRLRGDDDRRQVLVRLTALGEALLSRLALVHRAELRLVGPALLRALRTLDVQAATATVGRRRPRSTHRAVRASRVR